MAGSREAVSFRAKLVTLFTVIVVVTVTLVTSIVSVNMRGAFERLENERIAALGAQFQQQLAQRGTEVTDQIAGIATPESTLRIAIDVNRPGADYSPYVNEAQTLAGAHHLDFLEFVDYDGTIISSAQWPARFGYKETWVTQPMNWEKQPAFLAAEEMPQGTAVGLIAVRVVQARDRNLYIVGGRRLDREFLASLSLPKGMRALLYLAPNTSRGTQSVTDIKGAFANSEKLQPLLQSVREQKKETTATITWSADPASAETFQAIPLLDRGGDILGAFLVGSSREELVHIEQYIRSVAFVVGAGGVLLGFVFSGWVGSRVTRPMERLVEAAREVAAGDWNTQVAVESEDELGELADAFNRMTVRLTEQRDQLVQAERVAAWRELARRLAHELKNPLFPLQITIENLLRAREQSPAQFDEVFRESTATLLAELTNLKNIIARFSDFAKMPAPQLQAVNLNQIAANVVNLFSAQFNLPGKPPIESRLEFDDQLEPIQADPDLLHRAVQNLVLNAMDAMPSGGTLRVRTAKTNSGVRLEVSDTGKGLTREECQRLFTPYYTTKQHGTGLGLAIVQSVVSDHGGHVSVSSEPERGTTFQIDLPRTPPLVTATGAAGA
ncbi:MAG TPA: ATP-binding protein [Terriglobales bacterium]|nr:ATP-binding protein [Terriglobales bacterium]